MKIIGIDLSGPRNIADTCVVCFEQRAEEIHLIEVCEGADDDRILQCVSGSDVNERIVIGIDAPLSYNPGGGDREADRQLRQHMRDQGVHAGVMTPTMMRMVYLTLRGIALTRLIESLKPRHQSEIVEVHPGACMILRGANKEHVRAFKKDPAVRGDVLHWLETKGLMGIARKDEPGDHYVAACAAALGAWQWAMGKPVWCFAKALPHHPYDFAC
jgi:predicted nuclease with RNAse H fold